MANRISLYKFVSDMSIKEISNALIDMRYTENKQSGFMLVKVNSDLIAAKHVTEVLTEREVISPFGDVELDVIKEYLINEFEIHGNILKIKDATKSLSTLRNDLSKALKYRCSISFPHINLNSISENISAINSEAYVTSVEVLSRNLMQKTSVKMIISGNEDIISKMKSTFGNADFDIRRLTLTIPYEGKAEISYRGGIKVSDTSMKMEFYNKLLAKFIESDI